MISSAGIGSGLDVTGLVNTLVSAERQPFELQLRRQETRTNYELSGLGALKSAMDKLNTALESLGETDTLDARTASSGDEEFFTASADAGAAIGSYEIEIGQIAQSHRLASATAYASADTDVGYGQLDISLGAESFSVTIDSGAQTLADVRDAINDATDNPGVSASIINSDAGAVLVLGSSITGTDSEIQVAASGGDGGLDTLVADLATTKNFQDAQVYIDGNLVTSSSNTVSGAIEGVSINLLQGTAAASYQLDVTRSTEGTVEAFQSVVDAYNDYVDTVGRLGSSESTGEAAGSLNADSLLRGFQNQLRIALSESYGSGETDTLLEFGISLDVDGRMSLDETQLDETLDADPIGVRNFFTDSGGFTESLTGLIDNYIKSDGLISGRIDNLEDRLDRLEDRRSALDYRMEQVEDRYLRQFTALDSMLAQLQQVGGYLSQQLANLPGARSSSGGQ